MRPQYTHNKTSQQTISWVKCYLNYVENKTLKLTYFNII